LENICYNNSTKLIGVKNNYMYINRNDALEILGKLSREPSYQHSGEDYYVGIAEATGEIASIPAADIKDYKEIAKKLWTYICIIDSEKGTYEELADAIGLSDDELPLCRRLER
jgi:hypothetical protein